MSATNKELASIQISTLKQENQRTKDVSTIEPVNQKNEDLPDNSYAVDRAKPPPTSLRKDFIPEEIFVALTSAANPAPCPSFLRPPKKTKSTKDFQGCIRTADGVWQHPLRRNKFRYLIQHPICLTGAGRDVSFLYDVVAEKDGKNLPSTSRSLKPETTADKLPPNIADSLVPEEFHILKNRGVIGLEYYDDKYTTLLEDAENRLRVFPSMKPSGRLEVLQLMKVMDTMLEKAGTDNVEIGVTGLSQMHNVLDVLRVEQNIYNIVFHEIIRQVSVDCAERGELLSKLRQRYVELLERIPRQMRNLYKEIMAQRVMDKHITDELFYFKEAIKQLTRELNTIREHDRKTTLEAEKAYDELAKAVRDSEMNANLLDEYRELYELQRARLEAQIHQLNQEKELWSNATYDLALKVIEKNKLILARRMYDSEKAWVKVMRHFAILLASQDASDLSTLQQLTQDFRELLVQIGAEIEQAEESSRERIRSIQNGFAGWLNYFQNQVLGRGSFTAAKGASLMEQVFADLKVWEKMLNDELVQYGGDVLLVRQEPLRKATKLQKRWVDLGAAVHGRHKDPENKMPPEFKILEKINRQINVLFDQYRIRISGENGSARILTFLVSSLEDWTFKMLAAKQKPSMFESEWIKFFDAVSDWLAQIEDLLKFTGSSETQEERRLKTFHAAIVPGELFKKIRHWILTTTSGSEKENVQLTEELTDFHNILNKWMVSLLIHMVPDCTSRDSLPLTEAEIVRQAEQKVLDAINLEGEAVSLAAKMTKFSSYVVSCCKEMVAAITRSRMANFEENAEREVTMLEKIKTECLDWIETCTLLLSGIKTSPTSLISQDELISLFGIEAILSKRQLPPSSEHTVGTPSMNQTVRSPNKDKTDEKPRSPKVADKQKVLEAEKHPPEPGVSAGEQAEGAEITYPVRYIGHDANIHVKSMKAEEVTVSQRELQASQWTTQFSKKEFEMLASLEILEERLIEAEKRAQQAEEKSEQLHEELEEALTKIQDLEGGAAKSKPSADEDSGSDPEHSSKPKTDKPSKSAASKTSSPRSKKHPKSKH